MISKKDLQYYSSLLKKKYRKIENKFIVEGKKSVLEGLDSIYKCEIVFATNQFIENNETIKTKILEKKIKFEILKQKEFQMISDTETPEGIAAVFSKSNIKLLVDVFINEKIVVMLDNISDPGNLGTIIRNCDWFGVKNILLSHDTVEFTNPKVVRSSMGSIFHLNIYENVEVNQVEDFKNAGFEILCADLSGENVFNYKSKKKKVLILSSESHGPSDKIEEISDKKISIPKIGNAESLNVASASAVLLSALTK